jgi:hypothetical protein
MEAAELPDLQVLVHCFSRCYCRSNTFSADHIKVRTLNRLVEPGQAVALSYGIGNFDRQKHLFGHVDGLEPEPELVRLEFGGEWEIQGLMDALVTLSEKHGAIWFDQLSIPQDPASITLHLQNMPRIYREFEVVVHLPNAPCPCLAITFESWQSNGLYTQDYLHGDFDIDTLATRCPNAFPVSSYHFRLWTKQEFIYARAISSFYCGAPGKCYIDTFEWPDFKIEVEPTPPEFSGHLSRWGLWKYASYIGMISTNSEITRVMKWETFFEAHHDGEQNLFEEISSFLGRKACNTIEAGEMAREIGAHTARFLLGLKLQRAWTEIEDEFVPGDLESGHVEAIFEVTLQGERSWDSWPEINHENVCYNIMCDHLRIHPDVAREKGLGLIVKVSDPPCIGLVNGVVYNKIRRIEQCQRRHGSSAAGLLRKDSGLCPEDWLTITLDPETASDKSHLTLEATISNTLPQGIDYDCTLDPLVLLDKDSAPMYTVIGVWHECLGDDPCIGAELIWDLEEDYGAILI